MKSKVKTKDLTGQKFGRLTVLGIDETKETRKTFWICQCDCGNLKSVRADYLQSGGVKSCGCLKRDQDKINLTSHHLGIPASGTRLYKIWIGMKSRCSDINNPRYSDYGGRGIALCDEWNDDFKAFYEWSHSNCYQDDLTIDRIDNDGNYCPENCRWVDNKVQCRNRRSNINITIGNATKTLTEWCEIFELDSKTVFARLQRNEDISLDELFSMRKYRGNQ